jgi:hypothetical protein
MEPCAQTEDAIWDPVVPNEDRPLALDVLPSLPRTADERMQ